MIFEHELGLLQFLLPCICLGMQAGGLMLYLYISYINKSKLYLGITFLSISAMMFVGGESMLLTFGGWLHNRPVSLQFHRIEQLGGVFFLFSLPLALKYLAHVSKRWQKINTAVIFLTLAISVVITAFAFMIPDSFISMTQAKASSLIYEADYGRGQEGPLYLLRDILLAIIIFYCIISLIIDIKKNNSYEFLIFPLIGLIFVLLGALIDALHIYTHKFYDFFPNHYFSRVCTCATIAMLFFIFSVMKRFVHSAKELEKANKIISISEEKYRFLVEGTDECIFSMNRDMKIINANKSALMQLCIDSSSGNTSFFDLLFISENENDLSVQLVTEKLDNLFYEWKTEHLKVFFKSRGTLEPREYNVKIENISKDDKNEILVKASSISEDVIMKYLDNENLQLRIDNYLITAEEISNRLVLNLAKYMTPGDVNNVRVGLREIIINAIEHGNMNVTFDEKSNLTEEGNYIEYILKRQMDPAVRNKKICINYLLDKNHVEYAIQDEGNGFNYREILKHIKHTVDQNLLGHGRGLRMVYNIFDDVKFNRKGNRVNLIKYFNAN